MSDIADILIAQGRNRAEGARQSGAIWGPLVAQLGQIPTQLREQKQIDAEREADRLYRQQQQALAAQREKREVEADAFARDRFEYEKAKAGATGQEEMLVRAGRRASDYLAAGVSAPEPVGAYLDEQVKAGLIDQVAADAFKQHAASDPDGPRSVLAHFAQLAPKAKGEGLIQRDPDKELLTATGQMVSPARAPKEAAEAALKPMGTPMPAKDPEGKPALIQAFSDGSMRYVAGAYRGKTVDTLPDAPVTDKPDSRSLSLQAADALAAGDTTRYQQLIKAARDVGNADYHAPAGDSALVAIIGKDGRPVLVPKSQAVGKTPAGGAGGANRKVTSGDANRIADFTTSLDDLKVLRETVAPIDPKTGKPKESGVTGTSAKIGASLPNWATELTGWTAPKEKQAVIDRVKQVIGKSLEGGVLRKEDEYKYEKILPTVGDTPAVVRTKLNGLDQAIAQRKQRLIESLEDGGYDVSGYTAGQAAPATPAPGAPKRIRYDMNGKPLP